MKKEITLIIADDQKLFRNCLSDSLESETNKNIMVIGQAENGLELMSLLNHLSPDIVLLDIEMPVMNGYRTLIEIKEKFPEVKVIILSMHEEDSLVHEMISKGANGFLTKNMDIAAVIDTVYTVHQTGTCFKLIQHVVENQQINLKNNLRSEYNLSNREIEILQLISQCFTNKEIAEKMNIVERTVEFHKTNIFKKTKMASNAELIVFALNNSVMSRKQFQVT